MGELREYSAADVDVIFGTRALRGKAEDFLTISPVEDAFETQNGSDGEVTRSKTSVKSRIAEVTLQQGSPDNAYLRAIHNADKNTGGGVQPFAAIDRSGTYIGKGEQAFIITAPDESFARASGDRTWRIFIANFEELGGGSNVPGA